MKNVSGRHELRDAMAACRSHFFNTGVFSIFVNLLMLTGPLFMLQVYDRVLTSRSEATLVALLVLVTVLYFFMGALDFVRGRVLARAGALFSTLLETRVFTAVMRRAVAPQLRSRPNTASRDLDSIRQLLAGPAPFALFDVPWVPIYLGAIFLFHPILGWTATAGGAILVVITVLNQIRSRKPTQESQIASAAADNLGEQLRQNAESVQGLGMMRSGLSRWQELRERALETQISASDRTAGFTSSSKALRFYLQSVILAVGAWLVLEQELSAGMMIAASILMGRALAPIDQAIGQWPLAQRALAGWRELTDLLQRVPPDVPKTQLPAPKGLMQVQSITVLAPGETVPAIRSISFELRPGQALGVIGPSGAGKTTLAKALVGVWPPAAGKVRIDGASLDHWDQDQLGRHIGYLPQEIGLLSGTVAQNIARLAPEPDDAKVIDAARRAGAHELLLGLPKGYDTEIGAGGQRLSGGQRQRVALARALYDDPTVLVLDEPNANLDAPGEQALVDAIREAKSRGRTVIIMAHRPSAIAACDLLLFLDNGQQVDFGPRDEVLKRRTKNHAQIVRSGRPAVAVATGRGTPIPAAPPEGVTTGTVGQVGGMAVGSSAAGPAPRVASRVSRITPGHPGGNTAAVARATATDPASEDEAPRGEPNTASGRDPALKLGVEQLVTPGRVGPATPDTEEDRDTAAVAPVQTAREGER